MFLILNWIEICLKKYERFGHENDLKSQFVVRYFEAKASNE